MNAKLEQIRQALYGLSSEPNAQLRLHYEAQINQLLTDQTQIPQNLAVFLELLSDKRLNKLILILRELQASLKDLIEGLVTSVRD